MTGASSGIGFELAKQFAQNGFDLLITAQSDGIAKAAQELEKMGTNVETVQANLAEYDGVEQLYGKMTAAGRPVDSIAINAGVGVGGDFARQTDLKDELNLINLNVVSTAHPAKRVVKDMVDPGQGRILFTSSIAATMPGAYEAIYAASKAFISSFSEAIRNELKDTGVTVTSLMPGPTETNFFHRAGMDDTKVGSSEKDDPAIASITDGDVADYAAWRLNGTGQTLQFVLERAGLSRSRADGKPQWSDRECDRDPGGRGATTVHRKWRNSRQAGARLE